ncbi:uncharacterized protein LOC126677196 [Mercurialis annua]|uniref:uncharacterized protein LOC126677196 n=1 Tax=Mercurialis annua TaxID=3986 RepID=UPI00215F23F3|nr:uncharacterized protein LOC126677196 [Mercurialis annua]
MVEPQGRVVGSTEHGWCSAVPGGTGIVVLAILTSKPPETSKLETALHKLQKSHPILRSRLHCDISTKSFSFSTSPTHFIKVKTFNLLSTLTILETNSSAQNQSPLHLILEHELNQNTWSDSKMIVNDILFATVYAVPDAKWAIVLRLHAAACDRTTAVSLLKELLVAMVGDHEMEAGQVKGEISLAIEDLVPEGKCKKSLWVRGLDLLAYSVTSFKLTNLKFKDAKSARCSQVVRFQLSQNETQKILQGCKTREIKLCSALGAAGLIAAQTTKSPLNKHRKYAIVNLTDCRSLLHPPLSDHHFGFYHSVIINTHVIKGGENLWELAKKVYMEFANYKKCNRHFTDMADLNFLMCKAIENPSLTSSSSLRTSILSVFEDSVIEYSDNKKKEIGLEDYMGCASAHGIAPSIAIFDTIRDGKLDCVCVYPSPLHSREQMQDFVDKLKGVLIDGCN